MTDESIWVALEPVATGVGWFVIAALFAYAIFGSIWYWREDRKKEQAEQYRRRVDDLMRAVNRKDAA